MCSFRAGSRGSAAHSRHLVRCPVLSPVKEAVTAAAIDPRDLSIAVNIEDVRRPVKQDMEELVQNLMSAVGDRHPMLMAAAQQIFGAGGKKIRPMLVFLVARATCRHMGRCVSSANC
jgi:all-trans-nonaprenyl-diphosphate synthase